MTAVLVETVRDDSSSGGAGRGVPFVALGVLRMTSRVGKMVHESGSGRGTFTSPLIRPAGFIDRNGGYWRK